MPGVILVAMLVEASEAMAYSMDAHTSVSGQCLLLGHGAWSLRPELGIVIVGSSGTGTGLLQSWGLDTPVPFGHCACVCHTV